MNTIFVSCFHRAGVCRTGAYPYFLMGAKAVIIDLTFMDFNIELAFMLDCIQIVLVNDILWGGYQLYPNVLTVSHWDSIV